MTDSKVRPSGEGPRNRDRELVDLVYGEHDPARARALEDELAKDPVLAARKAAMDAVRGRLDAWKLSESSDGERDSRDLEELVATLGRSLPPSSRRRAPLRSAMLGVAAAFVAFLVLGALGARIERNQDRLALSIALPWSPAPEDRLSSDPNGLDRVALDSRAEAIARQTTTIALAQFMQSQAEGIRTRLAYESQGRARLVAAVDQALARERARTAQLVEALRRGAKHEDERTREAFAALAATVRVEER